MGFDPVSYLMGKQSSGGESEANILLNDLYSQDAGGGSYTFSKTVNIPKTGSYFVAAHGYSNSLTVKINGVSQELSIAITGGYIYWYENVLSLHEDDVIEIEIQTSKTSACSAQVIHISN